MDIKESRVWNPRLSLLQLMEIKLSLQKVLQNGGVSTRGAILLRDAPRSAPRVAPINYGGHLTPTRPHRPGPSLPPDGQ